MFVVIVDFTIHAQHLADFLPRMQENARLSVEREAGCQQFDVCQDEAHPESIFLYEIYDDRAAFDAHLASEHFKAFDIAVRDMVADKRVRFYRRLDH